MKLIKKTLKGSLWKIWEIRLDLTNSSKSIEIILIYKSSFSPQA